jgi:putative tricarboxylic transport membrane protein
MTAHKPRTELAIGLVCLVLGGVLAYGATSISSEAGYQGVGPNFLPWVVSVALVICGAALSVQALRGGWANRAEPEGSAQGQWWPFVWVSSALLLNALLITQIGFILSCALSFVVAVRGFHLSQGRLDLSAKAWLRDLCIGFALCAPVFWLFTKLLGISLPAITASRWI